MDTRLPLAPLLDRFRGPLVGLLASWGASPADATELAQETFTEAFLSRGRFLGDWDDPASTGPWLRGIARNLHRARQRKLRRVEPMEGVEVVDPASERAPEPEQVRRVRAALERLPERWREVLTMRYVDDCGLAEIAGLVGTSVRGVEGRLRRGRRELQKLMQEDEVTR